MSSLLALKTKGWDSGRRRKALVLWPDVSPSAIYEPTGKFGSVDYTVMKRDAAQQKRSSAASALSLELAGKLLV